MPVIQDFTEEVSIWDVTCHYDNGKEPASFIECMALFMLEQEQGWDAGFKPCQEKREYL